MFAVAAGASRWPLRPSYCDCAVLRRRPAAPRGSLMADVAEGIRTIGNRDLALLNGLAIAQTFTRGAATSSLLSCHWYPAYW